MKWEKSEGYKIVCLSLFKTYYPHPKSSLSFFMFIFLYERTFKTFFLYLDIMFKTNYTSEESPLEAFLWGENNDKIA